MSWEAVAASIAAATGAAFAICQCSEIGGGCINRGYRISGNSQRYFVKLNRAGQGAMFEAEAEGLRVLANTGAVRVPGPLCTGEDERHCWLVLEYHDLARGAAGSMAELGQRLAAMHRSTAERFGWLSAPASTVVQPGPVHAGLAVDPEAALDTLFVELVGEPVQSD